MRSKPIEDYALLSDGRRAALVARDGSIDWLCLPRFDSPACFAALLGTEKNGYWRISPKDDFATKRRYAGNTLILETDFETGTGKARVTDALVVGEENPLLIRKVEGLEGSVEMRLAIAPRFDYGSVVPWVRKTPYGFRAIAGPDQMDLEFPPGFAIDSDLRIQGDFRVEAGSVTWFSMSWSPHFSRDYVRVNAPNRKLEATSRYWNAYSEQCVYRGKYADAVIRSVLTLKALIYDPTGGIVAAPTTSLPETLGGERNWDYRFCWVRDSTFSLYALVTAGHRKEAGRWREWLSRAVAGTPSQVNIMYGLAGERRLPELELPWLDGYAGSKPVRTGNAAYRQLQLDVFGEAIETLYLALKSGLPVDENSWRVQKAFIEFLEENWDRPDEGIWEVRGPRRNYTHSKIMAWVAVDRALRSSKLGGLDAPTERWKALRDRIHADVCEKGFNARRNSFTQYYGSSNVDASLLLMVNVGFLPPDDPRVVGTVDAIEKDLYRDGFVLRYLTDEMKDVLHGREGAFLACSFWLVDCWILMGRIEEAENLFRRLLSLANDVGLLSEEYDTRKKRLVGNFPQALSHIALVNSAFNLSHHHGPAKDRSEKEGG